MHLPLISSRISTAAGTMPTVAVPKPVKKSAYRVVCAVCGTNAGYSFSAFDSHSQWCAAAKKKRDDAAREKAAKAHRTPLRR